MAFGGVIEYKVCSVHCSNCKSNSSFMDVRDRMGEFAAREVAMRAGWKIDEEKQIVLCPVCVKLEKVQKNRQRRREESD